MDKILEQLNKVDALLDEISVDVPADHPAYVFVQDAIVAVEYAIDEIDKTAKK